MLKCNSFFSTNDAETAKLVVVHYRYYYRHYYSSSFQFVPFQKLETTILPAVYFNGILWPIFVCFRQIFRRVNEANKGLKIGHKFFDSMLILGKNSVKRKGLARTLLGISSVKYPKVNEPFEKISKTMKKRRKFHTNSIPFERNNIWC